MNLLLDVALWGQHPDSASRARADWESYLTDFRAAHSPFETFVMTARSSVSHISWRVSSGEMPTTVPALLAIMGIAICSLIFPFVEPADSTPADVHISIAAILFTMSLAHQPWRIGHSKLLSWSMILGGTGGFHLALVFNGTGPAFATGLMIVGHVVLGIGLTGAGICGLLTKTAFGIRRVHMAIFGVGLSLIICANLLIACTLDNIAQCVLVASLILAEIGLLSQIPRLVEISERTSMTEVDAHSANLA